MLLRSSSDVEMLGIASIISGFRSWIKILTTPTKTPQKVLRSDVLDIFHSAYLPYVDCFRTDARFYNPKSGSYPAAVSWADGSQGGSGRVILATT
jgi:hypothetical protein